MMLLFPLLHSAASTLTDSIVNELIRKNIDEHITLIFCNTKTSACFYNDSHNYRYCKNCILRRNKIFCSYKSRLKIKYIYSTNKNIDIPEFKSVKELKDFSVDGINFGVGVASSLITRFGNENFNTHHTKDIIHSNLYSSICVYYFFDHYFKSNKFDMVYIFNGRFPNEFAIRYACIRNDIKYTTYDHYAKLNYRLFNNSLPHFYKDVYIESERIFNKIGKFNAIKLSEDWVAHRQEISKRHLLNHTSLQKHNLLPDNFDANKHNISFFPTSTNELASIEELQRLYGPYKSLEEMILKICESLYNDKKYHLFVRLHPHMGKTPSLIGLIQNILHMEKKLSNLTVISPDSSIDTYNLIKNSRKVIVTASTVGVESTLLSVPTILVGDSFYRNLPDAKVYYSHDEIISFLKSENSTTNKLWAIKYVCYLCFSQRPYEKFHLIQNKKNILCNLNTTFFDVIKANAKILYFRSNLNNILKL